MGRFAREEKIFFFVLLPVSLALFLLVDFYLLNEGFYNKINIAFDFDQAWFVEILSYPPDEWIYKTASDVNPLILKHPCCICTDGHLSYSSFSVLVRKKQSSLSASFSTWAR